MKRIFRIDIPLLGSEKVTHIRNYLGLGLGHEILDGLHQAILVSDGETGTSPKLAIDRICHPSCGGGRIFIFTESDRSGRIDLHGFNRFGIFQKKTGMNIGGHHVAWDTDCDGSMVVS